MSDTPPADRSLLGRRERRSLDRQWLHRSALLAIPGQPALQVCSVREVTARGAGIRLNGLRLLPLIFRLSFDGFQTAEHCKLVWRDGDFAGIVFLRFAGLRSRYPFDLV